MRPWERLTRRQQLWLLTHQAEAVRRARAGMTPSILNRVLALSANALRAIEIEHAPMPDSVLGAMCSLSGWDASRFLPYHLVPPHDDLPEPDMSPLRLWEGPPTPLGTARLLRVPHLSDIVDARLIELGSDRRRLALAANQRPSNLSHALSTGRSSITSITRIAYALELPLSAFGIDGGVPLHPEIHRPDFEASPQDILSGPAVFVPAPEPEQAIALEPAPSTNIVAEISPSACSAKPSVVETKIAIDKPEIEPSVDAPIVEPKRETPIGFLCEQIDHRDYRAAMHARMTRRRANAIASLIATSISIIPEGFDDCDAVEIEFDMTVPKNTAIAISRILKTPYHQIER